MSGRRQRNKLQARKIQDFYKASIAELRQGEADHIHRQAIGLRWLFARHNSGTPPGSRCPDRRFGTLTRLRGLALSPIDRTERHHKAARQYPADGLQRMALPRNNRKSSQS